MIARLKEIGVSAQELVCYEVFRRAYDTRKKADIKLTYIIDVELTDEAAVLKRLQAKPHPNCGVTPDMAYRFVARAPEHSTQLRPVVIGMGPCGLFAGLILAQMGFRPPDYPRARKGRARAYERHLGLWCKNELNSESNVQFGEGGAGTFSDGKLYSQIKDPKHYGRKVLDEFVKGGPEDILFLSRPHIGTFRLVSMVEKMRAQILHQLGGEVRFQQRVDDIDIDNGKVRSNFRPARHSVAITLCWQSDTARAIPSRCFMSAASSWKRSRSRSGFVSSIRKV